MGAEQAKYKPAATDERSDLSRLQELMKLWGDVNTERIFAELSRKDLAKELTIAFCGHFSAGKSSMINSLCRMSVLPSGPVPTSANIVSIRCGNPRVVVYPRRADGEKENVPWETTPERLEEYCRNGGEYTAIEVWEDIPLLGTHGVLMDTPGVDSTDDGHHSATHSALHLADVVFYVMDYNHVQSETNLAFAKNLSDWGKPLYLVVNQIDKHRESEISIEEYQHQMVTAFKQWDIQCAGVLFTSLKEKEHPLNHWERLELLIGQLLEARGELLEYSISCSIHHAADSALSTYREEQREQKEELLSGLSDLQEWGVLSEQALVQEQLLDLEKLAQTSRLKLRSSLDSLLENANLIPADVRELAGQYVESLNPGFRTGIWFTPAKRLKEQTLRLSVFYEHLNERIKGELEWHLLSLLRSWGEELELWSESAEASLKEKQPAHSAEWLAGMVKPGTGASGEALLNFCRGVAAEIKSRYRRAAFELADELLAKLPPLVEERRAELTRREEQLGQQARAFAALADLNRAEDARAEELAALLPPRRPLTPGTLPEVRDTPRTGAHSAAASGPRPPQAAAAGRLPAAADPAAGSAAPAGGGRRRLGAAAAVLGAAAERLHREPGMASAARSLAARAGDLAGGRFTMALFGAFSAGKSSFANALLGEDVLPVSPHPATAAVNRILAPEGDSKHGTAAVTMKSPEEIWNDIRHSFQVLQLGEPQAGTWVSVLGGLPQRGIHPSAQPHAGFLRAAAAGWGEAESWLGKVRTVDMEQYRLLVAEEKRACFVRSIDLFYSSPLTESGVILVDTPGADSLHARHTGVTFGYMKEADAICFVTYYNHAFSKADRSLLAQLGRIKDSFALDKMFFVINASDLAANDAELEEVRKHVENNLRAGGLTAPRIYCLSSLQALEGRSRGDDLLFDRSRFAFFESAFANFAGDELPGLSLAAAKESMVTVRHRVEEWRELASRESSQLEVTRQRLADRHHVANERMNQLLLEERPAVDLRREVEELLYHVRQRLSFSWGRFFQESFHPSLLREDAGNLKDIFAACGRELWRTVQRELEQECWATTLRLEAAGQQIVRSAFTAAAEDLMLSESEIQLLWEVEEHWPAPVSMESPLREMDWLVLWNYFKSPRYFFEGPGRDKVKTSAEPQLKEAIAEAAGIQEAAMITHYKHCLRTSLQAAADRLHSLLAEQEQAVSLNREGGDAAEHWSLLIHDLHVLEKSFDEIVDGEV
ncbi:dynamin family protein [Paenibacillus sp. sgz500958]|uniref:dynamin family protein n=1 Tax=Paenibacillus sp. sgz500958 TaxID=3242475 RepID=UPI0036D3DF13